MPNDNSIVPVSGVVPLAEMQGEDDTRRSQILLFAIAGGGAAMLEAMINFYPMWLHRFPFYPGVIFGVAVALCCRMAQATKPMAMIAIAAVSTFAYALAFFVVGAIALAPARVGTPDRNSLASGTAMFVAGTIGALVLFCAIPLMTTIKARNVIPVAMRWSFAGGVLGITGRLLAPIIGMSVWFVTHVLHLTPPGETARNALYSQSTQLFSIWFVWQTGIGALLGFILWRGALSNGQID
jgi:hypothetical protein